MSIRRATSAALSFVLAGLAAAHGAVFVGAADGVAASHTSAKTLPIIKCPLKNESHYFDIVVKPKSPSQKYCAPVSVRQCRDGSGCVGLKYSKASTLYESCGGYTAKKDGHNPTLPAILRIDADPSGALPSSQAKYLEFVCDPAPGRKADVITEFWPTIPKWPSTLPIADYSGMVEPGWQDCFANAKICGTGPSANTTNPIADYCCDSCLPRNGFVVNTTLYNPFDYEIKVMINQLGGKYAATTCIFAEITGTHVSAPADAKHTLLPPGSTTDISLPIDTLGVGVWVLEFVPMHHAGAKVCGFEHDPDSGDPFPSRINIDDYCGGPGMRPKAGAALGNLIE